MRPETVDQVIAREKLEARWKERAVERATIKERYAAQMREELAKADREVSRAMHRAREAGMSKSRIGRLIGTADWRTINNFFELTAEEFTIERVVPALQPDFVRFTTQVEHAKGKMKATLYVRGDGTEVRKTPREVNFRYRNAATFADFNTYSAAAEDFDIEDHALLREVQAQLESEVPPGRAIKIVIQGVSADESATAAPAWMSNRPLSDESWLEEE